MNIEQILGWTATSLFTLCYIPQITKMIKTNSVQGVSFLFLFTPVIANIIALSYATLIDQDPLKIKYILGLIFSGACCIFYWRTKHAFNQQ